MVVFHHFVIWKPKVRYPKEAYVLLVLSRLVFSFTELKITPPSKMNDEESKAV
jgi:hypothetical protein